MNTYELINPSDPYTFKAPNLEIAGVCALLLSNGFGARQIDPPTEDNERTPVLFGWKEWLDDRGIDSEYIDRHAMEIAEVFDSFLIGDINKRRDVEEMLALIPEDKRQEWKDSRQDRHRSSINRIGEAAYKNAKAYREHAEKLESAKLEAEYREQRKATDQKAEQFEEDLKSL